MTRSPSLRFEVRRAVPGVAAAFFAAACLAGCADAVLPRLTTWQASLQPMSPAQRVVGDVVVLSQSGRADASITISRSGPGAAYSWRLLVGSCGAQGAAIVGRAVFPQLTAGADGIASGQASLSRELDPDGAYAAWLFQVATGGAESAAACGVLRWAR